MVRGGGPSVCSNMDGPAGPVIARTIYGVTFPLSCLYTMSTESGILPTAWKVGYVCPIFKKGARQLPSCFYDQYML